MAKAKKQTLVCRPCGYGVTVSDLGSAVVECYACGLELVPRPAGKAKAAPKKIAAKKAAPRKGAKKAPKRAVKKKTAPRK